MEQSKPAQLLGGRIAKVKLAMVQSLLERTGLDRKPPEASRSHRPRLDMLTARHVDVAIVFLSMLGHRDAVDYLESVGMRTDIAHRVLERPALRRGVYDENGLRIDSRSR